MPLWLGCSGSRSARLPKGGAERLDALVSEYTEMIRAELDAIPVEFTLSTESIFRPEHVQITCLHGAACGIDSAFDAWAESRELPRIQLPASWKTRDGKINRRAGFQRNARMARFTHEYLRGLKWWVFFPGGNGTDNMFDEVCRLNQRERAGIRILDWRDMK